jgi:methylmalonyl-CoA/ethylmalonyl-CoA epimerase
MSEDANSEAFVNPGLRLHHLGVACGSIESEAALLENLGYVPEGTTFEDPNQGIRGRFMTGGGARLELLEELGDSGVLRPWLTARVKIYHQAYETPDLDRSLAAMVRAGARVTKPPLPAVAFGGRRVVFAVLPNLMLVELIEAEQNA